MGKNRRILIATAFPTQGAGSGALVTTQAKSYIEENEKGENNNEVVIITANSNTEFDKLNGVRYHLVPFTAETENPEKIEVEGQKQLPFNFLMFTTHTQSTANFWNVSMKQIEDYCAEFKKALKSEVKNFNPDVIHAQHNWLLSSLATEMGKPVVTTIHGTDLMGYERSKVELARVEEELNRIKQDSKDKKSGIEVKEIELLEEVYKRSSNIDDVNREIKRLIKDKKVNMSKADVMKVMSVLDSKRRYEFYINESEKSARNSEKIIVISDAQKEKFTELFPYAADKVVLLENGYDPKTFYREETDKSIISSLVSDNTPDGKISEDFDSLILFVGKFADFKGIDSMLTAAKMYEEELIKRGKKPLTLIVGSGVLEKKLKEQAKKLGLKNTHFVGRKNHEEIRKLQNLADVSLIPSRDEPFGLVVIEGTACGHPVIASNSGGIPGILNTTKQKLPNERIIKTPLGVLVKPLPVRPSSLTESQKDELDKLTTEYVVGDETKRKEILVQGTRALGLSSEVLEKYFADYTESTRALSDSVVQVVGKEITFDGEEIADYTKRTYSQDIIRDKIFGVFDEAGRLKKIREDL